MVKVFEEGDAQIFLVRLDAALLRCKKQTANQSHGDYGNVRPTSWYPALPFG